MTTTDTYVRVTYSINGVAGHDDFPPGSAIHVNEGNLYLYDKPLQDPARKRLAVYAPGVWARATNVTSGRSAATFVGKIA